MTRRLLNLLTIVSLLLCVAACALWMRSYWSYDILFAGGSTVFAELHSAKGGVTWIGQWESDARRNAWVRVTSFPAANHGDQGLLEFGGSSQRSKAPPVTWRALAAWAPHWAVAGAAGALPTRRMLARRRRSRRAPAHTTCDQCGYDLRATPDTCPECGAAAKPAVAE